MPNVITFIPRPLPVVPRPVPPAADLDLRAHIEEAAQTALDAADKIIAALDRIDDGAVIESRPLPVFTAAEPIQLPEPAEVQESQLEITSTPISEPIEPALPLRWYGGGNIISATGIALFELLAGS